MSDPTDEVFEQVMASAMPPKNEFVRACIAQGLSNDEIYSGLARLYGETKRSTTRSIVAHARRAPVPRKRCEHCGR